KPPAHSLWRHCGGLRLHPDTRDVQGNEQEPFQGLCRYPAENLTEAGGQRSPILDTDPGADSKALYDLTRSEVIKGTGATSEPELEDLGNSIVKRNDDVRFHLRSSVAGYSHEIGTELNVSSTILGLSNVKYVVTQFQYDSKSDRTTITLHPRVSVGYQNWKPMGSTVSDVKDTAEDARVDTYVPEVL
ncbi:MAG: hypothetical protein R6V83_07225, partial [Candidatus Thorarchaeota archaeon]